MQLRNLAQKDVSFILEWMKDPAVNCFFQFNPDTVSELTVQEFVAKANEKTENCHLACVDKNDEYLGTISLKEIDVKKGKAEYAVAFRTSAQGTGAAKYATKEILRIAFYEKGLMQVYLNVLAENERAIAFYEKIGFEKFDNEPDFLEIKGEKKPLAWFAITKQRYGELYG